MGLTLLEKVVSLFAPLNCYICSLEGYMLCLSCREKTLSRQESRCYICNRLTKSHTVCTSCRSRSRLRRVFWLGLYDEPLKGVVYAMKYHRRRAFAYECGRLLADALPYLPEDTLVVPVPTASARVRIRGYDQAQYIAKGFAETRGLRVAYLLRRTSQVDQIGKRRNERLKQMQKSFAVPKDNNIQGATILLVDDVLTTGATLESAAALLRSHGAKHIDAVVVARHLLK